MSRYVELQVLTHFSLLRGASGPDELFAAAALRGYPAIGISDIGTGRRRGASLGGAEGHRRSLHCGLPC
ncbi:hypothetical protein [Sphingomonas xinjiangensis]|uniref:PHP domain-containing protein n=1 Tax=Sphingomonas xinjiangensis TaxID=643568 RepID=A0A840YSS9_9SPHN|nr:hypothetical protein [Sphingomonas xinjiangensis]MBB5712703.1 hypothetical protein [Sphingomonas xinjiangensis]